MSDSSRPETPSPERSTPPFRTLDAIASDYQRAEITALWLHHRDLNAHTMLYAVVELCPAEQPESTRITAEEDGRIPMRRRNINDHETLYSDDCIRRARPRSP